MDVAVVVFSAGGVLVEVDDSSVVFEVDVTSVGGVLVTRVGVGGPLVLVEVLRLLVLVEASASSSGFGGVEVVVSDAVVCSVGEVTVVIGGNSLNFASPS